MERDLWLCSQILLSPESTFQAFCPEVNQSLVASESDMDVIVSTQPLLVSIPVGVQLFIRYSGAVP